MKTLSALGMGVITAVLCAAPITIHVSSTHLLLLSVDAANARIGQPATPMSVAGVNRRVHRRAYNGAAAIGAYRIYDNAAPCGFAPYLPC